MSGRARAWLRASAVAVLFAVFTWDALSQGPNPDSWFILATGREIAENGVPRSNPFAPEGSGYAIVVQQWGYCLLSYLCYSRAGWAGVLAMNYAFYLSMLAATAFAVRSFRFGEAARSLDVAMLTYVIAGFGLTTARPHSLDCAVWLFEVGALERFRRGDARYLAAVPALCVLHANMHVSMAPVDAAVPLAYAAKLPGPLPGRALLDGYRRLPVAAVSALCAAALFATPYGADGAALLLLNAGGSCGIISECLPALDPSAPTIGAFCLAASLFVALGAAYVASEERAVDVPACVMLAGAACLTLAYSRCYELLAVALVPACAAATRPVGRGGTGRETVVGAWALAAALVLGSFAVGRLDDGARGYAAAYTPEAGVDAIEELGAAPGDLVVTSFYSGGYLEMRGYRVTLDTRYEIWNPAGAKSGRCTAWADYAGSCLGEEGAAGRYVGEWEDGAEWAVVGFESMVAGLDGRAGDFHAACQEAYGRSVLGYLDSSPLWERVHGSWEDAPGGGLPAYCVYRKSASLQSAAAAPPGSAPAS